MSGYWEPLASEDPIPGEPGRVEELAGELGDVASRIDSQLAVLEGINAGEVWDSDAAERFVEVQGELVPDLSLAQERYSSASGALAEFAPELRAAQEMAETARVDARKAQDDIEEAQFHISQKEAHDEAEARRVDDHADDNPDAPPIEAEPYAGAHDPQGDLEDAERRLDQARDLLEEALQHRDTAASVAADLIHDARNDDLKDPSGWRRVAGAVGDWVSDRWDDITDAWDTVSDALGRLGEMLAGWALDALKYLGVKLLQALCLVLEVATLPLMLPLGVLQVTMAFIAGERDLGALGRHFVNSRASTIGQLLGLAGGGNVTYNHDHGVWVVEGAAEWTHGHTAMTLGSTVITHLREVDVDACRWDALMTHEAVHTDQWASMGGGFVYAIAYLEDWAWHDYEYSDEMWLESPAYEAGRAAEAAC